MTDLDDGNQTITPAARADAMPFEDLSTHGVLWLVNAAVFHPRGYALAIVKHEGKAVGWKLLGDGGELWTFKGVEQGSCDPNFAAVEALFAGARQRGDHAEA